MSNLTYLVPFDFLKLKSQTEKSIWINFNKMLSSFRQPLRRCLTFRFVRYNSNADILAKYQQKLQGKAKTLGLSSVDELQTKLKDEIQQKKKEFNVIDPLKQLEEYERKQTEEYENEKGSKIRDPIDKSTPKLPYKTLNSFVDEEKVSILPRKELELIWKARFSQDQTLSAVVEDIQFASMYANAFKNSSFILPLPKGDGYELHFVQWAFVGPKTTHCMLTTLAEYKLHQEYAKPHTTLMFHQELVGSKGIVLMNGAVEKESNVKVAEAHLLVLSLQRFYGAIGSPEASKRKLNFLKDFTSGNPDFNIQALIDEATSFE